jgi:hypothetical protein
VQSRDIPFFLVSPRRESFVSATASVISDSSEKPSQTNFRRSPDATEVYIAAYFSEPVDGHVFFV